MHTTLFLMVICLASCVTGSNDIARKDDNVGIDLIGLIKRGFRVVMRAFEGYFWTLPPWVKNCLVEFSCYFEKDPNFAKCAMYVVKCVAGELTKVASCFYNIVGDLFTNIFFEDWNVMNYDFGHLIYDIFECAGYDFDFIMGMVKPYFVKN